MSDEITVNVSVRALKDYAKHDFVPGSFQDDWTTAIRGGHAQAIGFAADEIMDMVPSLMSGALKPPGLPIPAPGAPSAVGGSTGSPVAIPTLPFGS